MDLLLNSKRAWLFSFLFFCGLNFCIYFLWFDKEWLRTIYSMIVVMLVEMMVFFILIILFKWTMWIRRIMVLLYVGIVAYGWIKGSIARWYVITPILFLMCLFMIWNIGGVKNCIIASPYKKVLSQLTSIINKEYEDYSLGVDRYNQRNKFNWFTKVRKKGKPNLDWYAFNSSGLDMFSFIDAIYGVSVSGWEKNIQEMNKKIERLADKKVAIYSDELLSEECNRFKEIRQKNRELENHNSDYDTIMEELNTRKQRGIKQQKKVFKKWI